MSDDDLIVEPAEEPAVEPEVEAAPEVDEEPEGDGLPDGPVSMGVTADGAHTNVAHWHDPEPEPED